MLNKHLELKICGFTRREDILSAAENGADYAGVILVSSSPRAVSVDKACELFANLPGSTGKVCVVMDPSQDLLEEILERIHPDVIQFHGREDPSMLCSYAEKVRVWKALPLRVPQDLAFAEQYRCERFLADAESGGSGRTCNWSLVRRLAQIRPVMLAGGIRLENLEEALRVPGICGIDAGSGTEISPGIKNLAVIQKMIHIVRSIQ